jgi:hypothetical protein
MPISNYGPYGVSINYRVNQKGGDLEKALSQQFSSLKSGAYKSFHLLAYRNWAGPVTNYHAFIPFEKFGDLDQWPSSAANSAEESHLQSHGAAAALGSDSRFLELVDNLSRVPKGAPAAYVVAIEYRLKPGAADEFENSAGKALKGGGVESVLTYRSFAGTTDSYHVALPFNKFADLDNWKSTSGILTGDLIKHVSVSIAELVPALSNPL